MNASRIRNEADPSIILNRAIQLEPLMKLVAQTTRTVGIPGLTINGFVTLRYTERTVVGDSFVPYNRTL